jgi:hypothetical protein
MSPAETERIKLTANFLNTLGSGTILASLVAPYIGWGVGSVHPDVIGIVSLSMFGFAVGVVLHFVARRLLGGLR